MSATNLVITGDSLQEMKKIADCSVDSIITDPPYGVLLSGKTISKGYSKKVYDNHCAWDQSIDFESFTKLWFDESVRVLKDNSFCFIFWSQKLMRLGYDIFTPSRTILWRYNNLTLGGNGDFAYDYEPIFVIKKGKPKLTPGKHSCDLEYTKPQSGFKSDKLLHPTQKPLKLLEHLIEISTKKGDIILDMFAGAGTTHLAALNLERGCISIEKEPSYVSYIQQRTSALAFPPSFILGGDSLSVIIIQMGS